MIYNDVDVKWMKRAIRLALLGKGSTSPNPLVGAVIINKFGNLIGEGFHQKSGMPHAEAMAFNNLREDPINGSLYVNLEPCCHTGKTPPCANRIIEAGIKKVYIAIKDPDKRVSGKGIELLKRAGIEVHLGLCAKESLRINKSFIYRCLTSKSYGVLKWAMSIDGRIGLANGKSKWISNDISRSNVHKLRADFDAIIIGGNTLRKDNPILTTRGIKEVEPLRVIFTKSLNLPKEANLWNCKIAKTLIVYDKSNVTKTNLENIPSSVEIVGVSSDNPRNLSELLAKKGYNKILWECGPKLATSAIKNSCIQETISYIAPKILGGFNSMNPIADLGFEDMQDVIKLEQFEINKFKDDLFLRNFLL